MPLRRLTNIFAHAVASVVAGPSIFLFASFACADTLEEALGQVFERNPSINAQRANADATGENIARTRSGYLPKASASADIAREFESTGPGHVSSGSQGTTAGAGSGRHSSYRNPRGYGAEIKQPLFDGFRTPNAFDQAGWQYQGALQAARQTEQSTLFDATRAYVSVIANRSILASSQANVRALQKQLEQIRARRTLGDATKTDVVQIEARAAAAAAQASVAEEELRSATAIYERIIGTAPGTLAPARSIDKLLPDTLDAAMDLAMEISPAILAANFGVDAARLQVRIVEGELLPMVNLTGGVRQSYDDDVSGDETLDATLKAQIQIPLYEGGEVRARARQAGHVSAQRQLEADAIRDQVRSDVSTAWSQLQTARKRLQAAGLQLSAATAAVAGIREEYRAGDRTTYDLLTAEQDYLSAQIGELSARRDRVIATYALGKAVGILDYSVLRDHLQDRGNTGEIVISEGAARSQQTVPAAVKPESPCAGCKKEPAVKPVPEIIETRVQGAKSPQAENLAAQSCKNCGPVRPVLKLRPAIAAEKLFNQDPERPTFVLKSSHASRAELRTMIDH